MWGTERSLKFQIVSRGAGDARINLGEDGVHNGLGVFQLQLHRNNVKRLQALGQRAQIDGVFFGGDEATSSRLLTSALQGQLKYALPLSGGVTVYVAATDLLPEVNREPNWRMALLVFVGVASLLIMQHLFHI